MKSWKMADSSSFHFALTLGLTVLLPTDEPSVRIAEPGDRESQPSHLLDVCLSVPLAPFHLQRTIRMGIALRFDLAPEFTCYEGLLLRS